MNRKVLIGGGILAAGLVLVLFKDKLFGTTQVATGSGNSYTGGSNSDTGAAQVINGSPYEGMVVTAPGQQGWYRVINGRRVVYQSYDAYTNDKQRMGDLVQLTEAEFKSIPNDPQRYISSYGELIVR